MQKQILKKIRGHGKGWVFSPSDFLNGEIPRTTVDKALSRLGSSGEIRRIRKGLYYYPKFNALWKTEVPPSPTKVIEAIARAKGAKIIPSGAMAANQLGLSMQVPMKMVYLTDMSSRQEMTCGVEIVFKHVSNSKLSGAGHIAGTIFSALDFLGKNEAKSEEVTTKISKILEENEIRRLNREAKVRPQWMREIVSDIVRKGTGKPTECIHQPR